MTPAVASSNRARLSRAVRPGSTGLRRIVMGGVVAILLACIGVGIYGLAGRPTTNYSDPRSWLPKQQLDQPVDRTVVGTVSAPALAIVGAEVLVKTPTFTALATVTGPLVPGEGLSFQASFTTCTWTVSIWHVTGRLPLAIADFDTIDHTGTAIQPALVVGQDMPSVLTTGQRASFQIRAVMPVGEGLMRWAPDGNNIVAKWDYQVEND